MALLIGVFVGLATQASESDKSFKEMLNFKEEFFFLVRARARNTQREAARGARVDSDGTRGSLCGHPLF